MAKCAVKIQNRQQIKFINIELIIQYKIFKKKTQNTKCMQKFLIYAC